MNSLIISNINTDFFNYQKQSSPSKSENENKFEVDNKAMNTDNEIVGNDSSFINKNDKPIDDNKYSKPKSKTVRIVDENDVENDNDVDATQKLIREKYFPNVDYNEDQHSWLTSLPRSTNIDVPRFDFQGNYVDPSKGQKYLEGLHHHGNDQGNPGYTIQEFLMLTQSVNVSQRILSLRSLTFILHKWYSKKYNASIVEKLDYTELGKALLAIRFGLNDRVKSIIGISLNGLTSIFFKFKDFESKFINQQYFDSFEEIGDSNLRIYSGEININKPDEMFELLYSPIAFLTFRTDLVDTLNDIMKPNSIIYEDELRERNIPNLTLILSSYSKKTANECVNTPLYIERFLKNYVARQWPQTSDEIKDLPDSIAIKALGAIVNSSRDNAKVIENMKGIDILLRFVIILPWLNSNSHQSYFISIEGIEVLSSLAKYGLGCQSATIIWDNFELINKFLINSKNKRKEIERKYFISLFKLLNAYIKCSIDPHQTTPHHDIVWTQVSPWIELGESCIDDSIENDGITAIEQATLWSFIATWLEGNRDSNKDAYIKENLNIEVVENTFRKNIEKVIDIINNNDETISQNQISKSFYIIHSVLDILPQFYDQVYELCNNVIIYLKNNEDIYDCFRLGIQMTVSYIEKSDVNDIKNLSLLLNTLDVIKDGDQKLLSKLLEYLFNQISNEALEIHTKFPKIEIDLTLKSTIPLLKEISNEIFYDGKDYGDVKIDYKNMANIMTLLIPNEGSKLMNKKWVLKFVLDHLNQSSQSASLKNLPLDWNYSEEDLVMGAITLQHYFDNSKGDTNSGNEGLLQLMRIYLLEIGFSSNNNEQVFRSNRVKNGLKVLLNKYLIESLNDEYNIEQRQEIVNNNITFYQLFNDFLGLFESLSLNDNLFSKFLIVPLNLSLDYRILLFNDFKACLKNIKLSWLDFPKTHIQSLLWPLEIDERLIKIYCKLLIDDFISIHSQPLLYWVCLHHTSLTLWYTKNEKLRKYLIDNLLKINSNVAKLVINYNLNENELKIPDEAVANNEEIDRRFKLLNDENEFLLTDKIKSL